MSSRTAAGRARRRRARARQQRLVAAMHTVEIADGQRAGRAALGVGQAAEDFHEDGDKRSGKASIISRMEVRQRRVPRPRPGIGILCRTSPSGVAPRDKVGMIWPIALLLTPPLERAAQPIPAAAALRSTSRPARSCLPPSIASRRPASWLRAAAAADDFRLLARRRAGALLARCAVMLVLSLGAARFYLGYRRDATSMSRSAHTRKWWTHMRVLAFLTGLPGAAQPCCTSIPARPSSRACFTC